MIKYSDKISNWIKDLGYTDCFFVAGGNIMHLLNSFNKNMKMTPFVHEAAAAIACEYFNLTSQKLKNNKKACCLFTAGPGITNAITGIAGSNLESREILVFGGQVKSTDLKKKNQRQNGIQEIDGFRILKPITKKSILLKKPISEKDFKKICKISSSDRKGAVFLEIPLDIQGTTENIKKLKSNSKIKIPEKSRSEKIPLKEVENLLNKSKKPLILLGGGIISSNLNHRLDKQLERIGLPFQTSWNGIDLVDSNSSNFFGRPNIWGQRYANIAIQECDLLISIGCRMGLQQTGFNYKKFAPLAYKIMIDIDRTELNKTNYKPDLSINFDGSEFLNSFFKYFRKKKFSFKNWIERLNFLKSKLPLSEKINELSDNFINPYDFMLNISNLLSSNDIIIPCSSGSANTVTFQAFNQKYGQVIMNSKSLASMGYGLSASIGAALSNKKKNVILFEGDGGFIQNLQEIGTLSQNNLKIKIFIFYDEGYASIRMTQKNYFNGNYIGCDLKTGLGLPNWKFLAKTYKLNFNELYRNNYIKKLKKILDEDFASLNLIHINPEQTYFPKIQSSISKSGKMESSPLDKMFPEVDL